jgi:hypothetical protein
MDQFLIKIQNNEFQSNVQESWIKAENTLFYMYMGSETREVYTIHSSFFAFKTCLTYQ